MAPWEIWSYDFDVEGAHPVVIFSNAVRVSNAGLEQLNVLFCTTLRREEQRAPKPHEVILDAADGLDWATRCRCDALHFVPKTKLRAKRGLVSWERRRAIGGSEVEAKGMDGDRTGQTQERRPGEGCDGGAVTPGDDDELGMDRQALGDGPLADSLQRGAMRAMK